MKTLKYSLAICLVAAAFFLLYFVTFRGTVLIENPWDRMPMEFEGRGYARLALGQDEFATTSNPVLIRHIFMGVAYPLIHQSLVGFLQNPQSPLVCSFGGALGIAVFGLWIYRRTRRALLSLMITLLLGFSFTTWYVGSVWESRSWIFLGGVVILLAVDRLIRKPVFSSLVLCVAATVLMLLICLGNLYNLVLVPAALFLLSRPRELRRKILPERRLGWRLSLAAKKITGSRALQWSGIYLFGVLGVVLGIYLYSGTINPILSLNSVVTFNRHQKSARASLDRLADPDFLQVSTMQALVYSVGGLRLPSTALDYPLGRLTLSLNEWRKPEAYRDYLRRPAGVGFILGYALLVGSAIFVGWRRRILRRDKLLAVILIWIAVYIVFITYIAEDTSSGFAAELMAPFWAGIALSLSRVRQRNTIPLLVFFLLFTVWNNLEVMAYSRGFYEDIHQWGIFTRRNLLYHHPATITADSYIMEFTRPAKAADRDPATFWHVSGEKIGRPTWLQMDFGEGLRPAASALAAYPRRDAPRQFLKDAVLSGSDDGLEWEKIIRVSQERTPAENELLQWEIPDPRPWRFYRLEITSGHSQGNFLSLAEIGLLE